MKHYSQLTSEQRYQISGLRKAGMNQSQVALELGVHKSTISRELSRNCGKRGWRPKQAAQLAISRRSQCANAGKFTSEHWDEVDRLIGLDMSPDQVGKRLALEGGITISHETIYRHIYANKRQGGDLWRHLRCQKPRRKRYASGGERRGMIKNRVSSKQRPKMVDEKTRLGDWEGDTVIGKNHQGVLVTLAERKSRYLLAAPTASKQAPVVGAAVTGLLKTHKDKCHSITFDNGKEFSEHEDIAQKQGTQVYFAHPYHSWERGLNENSNGLLRQYFPKGMELSKVSTEQVQWAVDRINHRPRKVLGYRTPYEAFFGTTLQYTRPTLGVALQI